MCNKEYDDDYDGDGYLMSREYNEPTIHEVIVKLQSEEAQLLEDRRRAFWIANTSLHIHGLVAKEADNALDDFFKLTKRLEAVRNKIHELAVLSVTTSPPEER